MEVISIIQQNLAHSEEAEDEFLEYLVKSQAIGLVQEPYLRKNKIKQPNGYRVIHCGKAARACIYLPNNVNAWLVSSTRDVVAVLTGNSEKGTILCSSYHDGDFPPSEIGYGLDPIMDYANRGQHKILIGLDSNAHSILWGPNDTPNDRGAYMEDWIFRNHLKVDNEGDSATFVSSRYGTVIDLTISSYTLDVSQWTVDTTPCLSDHRRIFYTLHLNTKRSFKRRNFKGANWVTFREELDNRLDYSNQNPIWDSQRLEQEVSKLENCIIQALDKVAPLCKVKINPRITHKDDELTSARALFKRIKRAYHQKTVTFEHYTSVKREYRRVMRRVSKERYIDFIESITDSNQVCKHVKSAEKTNSPIGLLNKDNVKTVNGSEVISLLYDTHFPGSKEGLLKENPIRKITLANETLAKVNFITSNKIFEAFQSFGAGKAAGDDFKPIVLRNLTQKALGCLQDIYRASVALGLIPSKWKKSRVVFIPKQGKPANDPKGLRPITLNSFLLKALEKILMWHLEKKGIPRLSKHQYAFKPGTSIDEALSRVVDRIEKGLLATNKNEYTLCCFLDISGAFDNVKTEACLRGAKRCQVPDLLIPWLRSLLTNREVTTEINGIKQTRILNCGTPQGGVWSPKLWNCAINYILEKENSHGVTCVGFADDMVLTMTGPDPNVLFSTLGYRANRIKKEIATLGLSLNTSKTEVVLYTNKRPTALPTFRIGTDVIPISNKARYLGVILDRHLTYSEHISHIVAKTKRSIFMLRNLVYRKFGPSPKLMRLCYTIVARTKLSYACHIWQHAKGDHEDLVKCQRLAMLTMAPTGRSMPTIGLEVIWGITPIHLHLQKVALATYGRIKSKIRQTHFGQVANRKGHLDKLGDTYQALGLQENTDMVTRRDNLNLYTVSTEKNPDTSENPDHIQIYTDGSKINGFAGCGFYMQDKLVIHQASEHLGSSATVFQGEILAIQRGAEHLKNLTGRTITFISDSQAGLQALDQRVFKSKTVWECHRALNHLARTNHVELKWTKAHVGTFGNEQADRLAKAGSLRQREEANSFSEYTPPISMAEIKTKIKNHIERKWQKEWENADKALHTWRLIPNINSNIAKTMIGLSRQEAKYMLQMLTGHCRYRYFQWVLINKKRHFDPTCPFCGAETNKDDTPCHALLECDRWLPERLRIFNTDRPKPIDDYHKLRDFFGLPGLRNHANTYLQKKPKCLTTVGVKCVKPNKVK